MRNVKVIISLFALMLVLSACMPEQQTNISDTEYKEKESTRKTNLAYEETKDEYILRLSKEELNNIEQAYYTVFFESEDESYVPVLSECSLTPNAEGEFCISKSLKLFAMEYDENEEAVVVPFIQKSAGDQEIVWESDSIRLLESTPVSWTGFSVIPMYTEVIINDEGNPDIQVYEVKDTDTTEEEYKYAAQYWNYIGCSLTSYDPLYDEEDNILGYESWEGTSYYLETEYCKDLSVMPVITQVSTSECFENYVVQVLLKKKDGTVLVTDVLNLDDKHNENHIEIETEKGKYEFLVFDKYAELVKYTGEDTGLAIPSEVMGKSVTVIGDEAFDECSTLYNIILPDGLRKIDSFAFWYCTNLRKIYIPSSVEQIGEGSFLGCENLAIIEVAPKNKSYKVEGEYLLSIDGEKVVACAYGAVDGIRIPSGVKVIENYAFAYMTGERTVEFPDGTIVIGFRAFSNTILSRIDLPDALEYIGSNAFDKAYWFGDGDFMMQEILYIGKKVSWIGSHAFDGCEIQYFDVDSQNENYASDDGFLLNKEKTYLYLCPVTEDGCLMIPEGVQACAEDAFDNQVSLKKLILPDSLETIDTFPVYDLEYLEIGKCMTDWEGIENCSGIDQIVISPENSRYLLEDGVIYNKEKTEMYLYMENKREDTFEIPETIVSIGKNACLRNVYLKKLVIPSTLNLVEQGIHGFNGFENLQEVCVSEDNPYVMSIDGVLFSKDKKQLYAYPSGKMDKEYEIPEGVEMVYTNAFGYDCKLEKIVIPSTLQYMKPADVNKEFFETISSLSEMTICENNMYFSIKDSIVYDKKNHTAIGSISDYPDIITFAEDTVRIGEFALDSLKIQEDVYEIHIMEGVEIIETGNFNDIRKYDQWDKVDIFLPNSLNMIAEDSFVDSPAIVIHASEGSYAANFAKEHELELVIENGNE